MTEENIAKMKVLVREMEEIYLCPNMDNYAKGLFYKMQSAIGTPGWICQIDQDNHRITQLKSDILELKEMLGKE